jgi:sialic acid synthase SpsE
MKFEIGNVEFSRVGPPVVIAEACDNHLGNMDCARQMCDLAKKAGAHIIKFQHHLPDEEMLKDAPMSSNFDEPLYDFLQKYALTLENHEELMKHCEKIGIQYLCTPFSAKAAHELNDIGVAGFKIGSGEMLDFPTLGVIASFGKPMILSSGMSTVDEIDKCYNFMKGQKIPFALLNCVSEYPANYDDLNLHFIGEMKRRYDDIVIGHSDHTSDLFTSFGAVACGARIIEKHVIIDKSSPGPDQSVSINFSELHELTDGVHKIFQASGKNKEIHYKEKEIRKWAYRSLVYLNELNVGHTITVEDIWGKRPGTGILSHRMNEFVGKKLKVRVDKNQILEESHF